MHVINYIISYEEEYAYTSYEEEDAWGHAVTSKGCPSLSFSSYTNSLGGQSETHMIHTSFKKTSFWSCSPYIHTHAHTHTHTNAHTLRAHAWACAALHTQTVVYKHQLAHTT